MGNVWLGAVLAVAGVVVGAFVNWVARPKWTERHPRRTLATAAVLALTVAGTPVVVSFLAGSEASSSAPPPSSTPVAPTVGPSTEGPSDRPTGDPLAAPLDNPIGVSGGAGSTGGSGGSTTNGGQPPQGGKQPVRPTDPVTITTSALPGIKVGDAWSADLAAGGGTPTYRWSLAGGSLPPGLVLRADGRIGGTATTPQPKVFTVAATDVRGEAATRKFSLKPVARTGDINLDGPVGCLDKDILQSQWNQSGAHLSGDLNTDGIVNLTDLSIMLSNWTGDSASCEGT